MGLWTTVKRWLGLAPPHFRDDDPPALSLGAVQRLDTLGTGVRLALVPAAAGFQLQVTEGVDAPPHDVFGGVRVVVDDDVLRKLNGLVVDHDGERWRLTADVPVHARETPNPDGRAYVTDRRLARGRLWFSHGATGAPPFVAALLARDDVRTVLLRDHTLTVERTPGADWATLDRVVAAAVRTHVLAAGGVLVPPPVAERSDALEAEVWAALEQQVLPILHRDGGDLELLSIDQGVVRIHLVGACRTCPASMLTVKGGVEKMLKERFPGRVESVESVA